MDPVLKIINRSSQRGGLLSVIELIKADTLSLRQAAWMARQIITGSSWLVGAQPGGAGKTTIMSALLGLLPPPPTLYLTTPEAHWRQAQPGDCVVAFECSPGHYDAYIWGHALRDFANLGQKQVRLVSNLHADTLDEARAQLIKQNGVAPRAFDSFQLFLPIEVTNNNWHQTRQIQRIFYFQGQTWQALSRAQTEQQADPVITAFLRRCLEQGPRDIARFRREWLVFLDLYQAGENPAMPTEMPV